ncbi:MAG: hypothetical protein HY319_26155 [Armatimonadetes bacterium]|nr:hypothetical protein [Armatimonadota bacterium]
MTEPSQDNKLMAIALQLAPAVIRNNGTKDPIEAVKIYVAVYDAVVKAACQGVESQPPV